MFLSATDRVMRGKKGTSGVHIMKTVQAMLISVYEEPIVAEQVICLGEIKLGIFTYMES